MCMSQKWIVFLAIVCVADARKKVVKTQQKQHEIHVVFWDPCFNSKVEAGKREKTVDKVDGSGTIID